MKQLRLSILILTLALTFQISCDNQVVEPKNSDTLVKEAKNYFENSFDLTVNQSTNSRNTNYRQNTKKTPDWDKAFIKEMTNGDAVVVPLHMERNLFTKIGINETPVSINEITYLLVNKDINNNHYAEVVTIMPKESLSYEPSSFSGSIIVEDWQGNFLHGFNYDNGAAKKLVPQENLSNKSNAREPDYWTCTTTDWYTCTSVNDVELYCSFNYRETSCSGGNIDSGGWITSGDYTYVGGGYVGGGWASGSTSINTVLNSWEVNKINDNSLKPCMQKILTDVTKITLGVGQLINKFSGSVPGWNWELKDGSLVGETASTDPPAFYNSATGTLSTTFDSQAWPNATELSWARTILHESIHAYLAVYFATDQQNFKRNYPQMVQDWETLQNWNAVHHEEFARSLVTSIADALEQYGKMKGYALERTFYEDMSWAGLQGTSTFQNLPSTDKTRILNTNTVELTGKDTTGTLKTQKGKNAGC